METKDILKITKPINTKDSKYKDLDLDLVKKLAEYGHSDSFMADFFGIRYKTWIEWKSVHPEFALALKSWESRANGVVKKALFEKAKGYSHPETIVKTVSDGKDLGAHIETVEVIKHYAPDTKAAQFWLTNRDPKNWSDKQEIEVKGNLAQLIIDARKRSNGEEEESFLD